MPGLVIDKRAQNCSWEQLAAWYNRLWLVMAENDREGGNAATLSQLAEWKVVKAELAARGIQLTLF